MRFEDEVVVATGAASGFGEAMVRSFAAAAFLCSEDASFVTGQVLAVDGGWSTTEFAPLPES